MNWFQIILMIISTPVTLVWVWLAVSKGKKYRPYTESVFAKEFPMSELFCVGFGLMDMFHIDTTSRRARDKIKEISEIRGKAYAEYYYYILMGAEISYGYTVFVLAALFGVLSNSPELFLLALVSCVLCVAYIQMTVQDKLTERREEILMDLPQVLSKLTLLVNSGMVLRDAWARTAITGERALYREMQEASLRIANGEMEIEAYRRFAENCHVKEVRKFAGLVIQNLETGNEELAGYLKDMSAEMWELKKNEVKRKGEKANSKPLFPVLLIFIGILLMILVPVMSGVG